MNLIRVESTEQKHQKCRAPPVFHNVFNYIQFAAPYVHNNMWKFILGHAVCKWLMNDFRL